VYSLTCLLYECLTAEAPFSSGSRLGVAWAHLEEEPPSASSRNNELPGAIDAVIAKGMAKEPPDRYQTCGELISAARQALGVTQAALSRRRTLALVAAAASLATFAAVLGTVLLGRGEPAAATSNAAVRADTLVRIDPESNTIKAVIEVGEDPVATAVSGGTIWVYNRESDTISQVAAETNSEREVTPVSGRVLDVSPLAGPLLAADPGGAWLLTFDMHRGKFLLTRFFVGSRRNVVHPIPGAATAVAVGREGVWVLTMRRNGNALLQIDPKTGSVSRTIALKTDNATSLGVGEGRIWVVSQDGVIQRVDPRSGKVTGRRDVGECSARPGIGLGSVWLCVCNPGSSMLRMDPVTLRDTLARNAVPAQDGMFSIGYGSLWWHDTPSGTVIRFASGTGERSATVRVTPTTEMGLATTSIASGADSVWVTVARGT
jgi:DNA-binding beta-propeller fold protein YncE